LVLVLFSQWVSAVNLGDKLVDLAACSHVALSIPKRFEATVHTSHQHVVTDIKFSVEVKQGILDVALNYKFPCLLLLFPSVFDSLIHLLGWKNLNSLTAASVFSRLDYPKLFGLHRGSMLKKAHLNAFQTIYIKSFGHDSKGVFIKYINIIGFEVN
jgi:hypothetical protein